MKDLPKEIQPVYSLLNNYQENNVDKVNLSVADLANILATHKVKDPEYYQEVLSTLETLDVSGQTTKHLIDQFLKEKLLKEISLTAYDITEGKVSEDNLLKLVQQLQANATTEVQEEFDVVSDDLAELLSETYLKPGLRWRLDTLNKMLGSLRGGDFGFIFARPETGKTTFLASETTYMAEQLSDEAGPILWFNNEEKGSKVKLRCYQAALGTQLAQLNSNVQAAADRYRAKTKGKHVIIDGASISKRYVEKAVAHFKPSLVIFDQIDKIHGFEADREDLKLGAMYQWAREIAKSNNIPVIGVCQADGTGEGVKWLTMNNVSSAKTSKQAEADWILGIGKIHDSGYENLRFLHASKNKLSGDADTDPNLRHGKKEVIIRADIARYEDIK